MTTPDPNDQYVRIPRWVADFALQFFRNDDPERRCRLCTEVKCQWCEEEDAAAAALRAALAAQEPGRYDQAADPPNDTSTRLVPITREQRDTLAHYDPERRRSAITDILTAYDAASARTPSARPSPPRNGNADDR